MSQTENNKQIDADILQYKKADVLRARDIIPGNTRPDKKNKSQETGENKDQSTDAVEMAAEKEGRIPTFNLAEDIMAAQRKISSIRRKAPGQRDRTQSQQPEAASGSYHAIARPMPTPSQQEQIIAEIVARDIERLCRGDKPDF